LVGEAQAEARLKMQVTEKRELTGRGDDLECIAHRTSHLAHAIVPERFALLLARARQGEAHRLGALLDGNEVGGDDARRGQREQIDHLTAARHDFTDGSAARGFRPLGRVDHDRRTSRLGRE
jgi:hypothetical protein